MRKTLILGGTTEASALAQTMASSGLPAVLSYAGRVANPRPQPVPLRIGGFGGVDGLRAYLRAEDIGQIVDATHPFAAQISRNAIAAAKAEGVHLCAFERAPWVRQPGDNWREVFDLHEARLALGTPPRRIFLAIGRQHLDEFSGLDQHFFLTRLVDAPQTPLPLANGHAVIARGPFDLAGDLALMREYSIDLLIAKNAGGRGAEAKLQAARALGLQVILIARPEIPPRQLCRTLDEVMAWLHAHLGV